MNPTAQIAFISAIRCLTLKKNSLRRKRRNPAHFSQRPDSHRRRESTSPNSRVVFACIHAAPSDFKMHFRQPRSCRGRFLTEKRSDDVAKRHRNAQLRARFFLDYFFP
jgi:hypothetical protein